MTAESAAGSEAALNAALAAASRDGDHPHRLDDNRCTLVVPLPAGLIDDLDELVVTIRLSGDIVTFTSPLASLTEEVLPGEVGTALLRRQFFASQTEGAGFAIADREDVVVAQYHWMPTEITPDGFSAMFSRFASAALRLRDEVVTVAGQGAPLHVLRSND